MTTGLELKVERVRARLTGRAVARAMGVSGQRVAQIEARDVVPDESASRYRDALRSLTNGRENVA